MFRNKRWLSLVLLVALLLSACPAPVPPSSGATTEYTPEFVPSACLYPGAPYLDTRCGYLRVPEDRSKPAGKTIELYDSGLPPYLSQPLTAAVEQSYYYQLPIGHAALQSYCGLQLATYFLSDPTQPPDASCIDDMGPHWLLPQG